MFDPPSDPIRAQRRPSDAPAPPREEVDGAVDSDVEDALEQLLEETAVPETLPQPARRSSDVRGRVALITGGSRGIGRAIATEFAAAGCHIGFTFLDDGGRSRTQAQETARHLRQMEVQVVAEPCDVREPGDVRAFVSRVLEELGGLHIVVNNAGIGLDRAIWHMSDHEWESVLRTNLDGAFHVIRATAPHLREQEWGKIVNIASVHGVRPEFGLANYGASKAGLMGLTRSAALELGSHNINVNAVAPGYIRTHSLTERVPAELLDRARDRSALGRLGDPTDVANVVVFLCSEAARHITGAVIPVDGGYLS
jgi:3-oxoacyl-[acyl-carrier protein] reductase